MKKYWFLTLLLAPAFAIANEPTNLASVKQVLIRYHDSGQYQQDINHAIDEGMRYLNKRIAQPDFDAKKSAIVLDIDETSLSNYPDMKQLDFGGTLEQIRQAEDQGKDAAIEPTLKLYQFAKAHHIAVFFLTGRFEEERTMTAANLQAAGYHDWDQLVLRSGQNRHVTAAVYKTAIRKQFEQQGYDILLNVGDQQSDLAGRYADKTVKLPNPYYFIP